MRRLVLVAACVLAPALHAQDGTGVHDTASTTRTTKDRVYSREQWLRGQDIYAGNCRSCHTPEGHASPAFVANWNGRTLAQLYTYIRGSMPKSNPGSLTPEEYRDVLAYLLRLNRMPTGVDELPSDSTALATIRFQAEAKP